MYYHELVPKSCLPTVAWPKDGVEFPSTWTQDGGHTTPGSNAAVTYSISGLVWTFIEANCTPLEGRDRAGQVRVFSWCACGRPNETRDSASAIPPLTETHLNHLDVRRAVQVRPDLLQAGVEQPRVCTPVRADLSRARAVFSDSEASPPWWWLWASGARGQTSHLQSQNSRFSCLGAPFESRSLLFMATPSNQGHRPRLPTFGLKGMIPTAFFQDLPSPQEVRPARPATTEYRDRTNDVDPFQQAGFYSLLRRPKT